MKKLTYALVVVVCAVAGGAVVMLGLGQGATLPASVSVGIGVSGFFLILFATAISLIPGMAGPFRADDDNGGVCVGHEVSVGLLVYLAAAMVFLSLGLNVFDPGGAPERASGGARLFGACGLVFFVWVVWFIVANFPFRSTLSVGDTGFIQQVGNYQKTTVSASSIEDAVIDQKGVRLQGSFETVVNYLPWGWCEQRKRKTTLLLTGYWLGPVSPEEFVKRIGSMPR